MKKLYKSNADKVLAGVIGGLGEYLEMDSVVLRLIYIFVTVITGIAPCVIAYIIAVLIVPKRPHSHEHHTHSS